MNTNPPIDYFISSSPTFPHTHTLNLYSMKYTRCPFFFPPSFFTTFFLFFISSFQLGETGDLVSFKLKKDESGGSGVYGIYHQGGKLLAALSRREREREIQWRQLTDHILS